METPPSDQFFTLFTSLIEPVVFKRKINWSEVTIGLAIIIVISYIGYAEFGNARNPFMGILMGVLAAFTASLFNTLNGKLLLNFYLLKNGEWIAVSDNKKVSFSEDSLKHLIY